ncbi:MAG: urease accessory protein UreE [Synechococcus sp.]|nr:urease accessory protein UreE [Synechococcus sp.]
MAETLLLAHRHPGPPPAGATRLALALSAEERTRLRGLRHSRCGRPLLLQLPREQPLRPGEWLCSTAPADPTWVEVEAAPEPLLVVRSADPLALLQAAYHLGNRHVALEIRPGELRLLHDPVLAHLLSYRALEVDTALAPFQPESGAYSHGAGHGHEHGHGHSHGHEHGEPQP